MNTFGVRTLKNRLSEYLRRFKAGETLLVTDRDEVVAELRLIRRRKRRGDRMERRLQQMAERGELTRAKKPGPITRVFKPLPGGPLPFTSAEILDQVRGARG